MSYGFKVQASQCATCIYRADSPLDVRKLEADITEEYGAIVGWRICHHSMEVCCRGFYDQHKTSCAAIRVAQLIDGVSFVDVDGMPDVE